MKHADRLRKKLLEFARVSGILNLESVALDQPEESKILVFSPHPDDDVIGCGGTLCKHILKNDEIRVVYVTDGGLADPSVQVDVMAMMRKKEAIEALACLGGKEDNLSFLDYPDQDLKCNNESIDCFLAILEDYAPTAIYVPFFLENHQDHRTTAMIVAEALNLYSKNITCYCYEIWSLMMPNHFIDITSVMGKKINAINAHKTQIRMMDFGEKIRGLNSYRSMTTSNNTKYCEAFYKCKKKEYITIANEIKKVDLLKFYN